eukprot:m.107247 g.107247  ORF g.107247 m.107247 type:complete len:434 (+) comp15835_c0_seq1:526-1827(+)
MGDQPHIASKFFSETGIPPGHPNLVVVLVGLPGRGKSYVAAKVSYYLNWIQIPCKVFNVGDYRRMSVSFSAAEKYTAADDRALELRRQITLQALDDMFVWFTDKRAVGILDGTNVTRAFRQRLLDRCAEKGCRVLFVESICNDDQQIIRSIQSTQSHLPDYKEKPVEAMIENYKEKVDYYRHIYQPMDPDIDCNLSFVRMVDVGRNLFANNTSGYLEMRITRFLLNLHVRPRTIYITRHGESEYNVLGKIGGDSGLSPRGQKYAARLKEFMDGEDVPNLQVWCSTLRRTIQTGALFPNLQPWKALDELDAGECDGMTYEETQRDFPEMYEAREMDKYRTRYPRGESYHDVVERLEPRLLELERVENLLIICHQAVARCLMSYFKTSHQLATELPYEEIPLHTVIKITPNPVQGCSIEVTPLGIDCVSTHRPRT